MPGSATHGVVQVIYHEQSALPFANRSEAGRMLVRELGAYANQPEVVVLALPRGGVPVAAEVASSLRAPLGIIIVRKLGFPGQGEFAMGAIASGGVRVLNPDVLASIPIAESVLQLITTTELRELARRERLYRSGRAAVAVNGKTVILVDDGVATGSSMLAAIKALRQREVARIVVATPVAPPSVCQMLQGHADEVVCLAEPMAFYGVGQWYQEFPQLTDQEVISALHQNATPSSLRSAQACS
jgi:putative phosphoribosyl transferase